MTELLSFNDRQSWLAEEGDCYSARGHVDPELMLASVVAHASDSWEHPESKWTLNSVQHLWMTTDLLYDEDGEVAWLHAEPYEEAEPVTIVWIDAAPEHPASPVDRLWVECPGVWTSWFPILRESLDVGKVVYSDEARHEAPQPHGSPPSLMFEGYCDECWRDFRDAFPDDQQETTTCTT